LDDYKLEIKPKKVKDEEFPGIFGDSDLEERFE
jgi:hypothetical protein